MTTVATRSVSFRSGGLTLEGSLHLPDATPAPGVVVCHPHPLYGGDMDNNVVLAACEALAARGIAALRFNFRGVGASDGAFDDGRGEREDVRAALAFMTSLPELDGARAGLIGYSFGAIVAADVATNELRALALVSPPVAFSDLRVAPGCPTLLLAGDMDSLVPTDRLHVLSQTSDVEMRIFEGADHSWWDFEDELGAALSAFFQRYFR